MQAPLEADAAPEELARLLGGRASGSQKYLRPLMGRSEDGEIDRPLSLGRCD